METLKSSTYLSCKSTPNRKLLIFIDLKFFNKKSLREKKSFLYMNSDLLNKKHKQLLLLERLTRNATNGINEYKSYITNKTL